MEGGASHANIFRPKCIASTGNTFCTTIAAFQPREDSNSSSVPTRVHDELESNCFRSAQLSSDGSCVITFSEDQRYRSFVLPPNLLDHSEEPHALTAYSTSLPVRSFAFTTYPFFDLSYPSTTLALVSQTNLPIRLTNILDFGYNTSTYRWEHPNTEAYIAPSSLAFTTQGTHFIAGASNCIAIFDLGRCKEGPVQYYKLKKSSRARKMYGSSEVELSGIVSSLAIDPSNHVLAAGTTNRQIGLFSDEGSGGEVASFEIGDAAGEKETGTWGNGVAQMKWSSDGRYLFIAERQSDALIVYDIRVTGKRLSWLVGRKAQTTHKLGFDLTDPSDQGTDVWAGGTDGMVRIWKDVTRTEGAINPDNAFKAGTDAVGSVLLHPTAPVFATASGQRVPPQDRLILGSDYKDGGEQDSIDDGISGASGPNTKGFDNTLKVWSTPDDFAPFTLS